MSFPHGWVTAGNGLANLILTADDIVVHTRHLCENMPNSSHVIFIVLVAALSVPNGISGFVSTGVGITDLGLFPCLLAF